MVIKSGLYFVVFFIALIVAFSWINSRLPSDGTAVAMTSHNSSGRSLTIFDTKFLNAAPGPAQEGTSLHEIIHLLKSIGFYDLDIPIAAATGYYAEWVDSASLYDKSKLRFLRRGLESDQAGEEVDRIMQRYRGGGVAEEDMRSYKDGAYLAGLTAKLFKRNTDTGTRYLLALAMSLT